jgi:VanZ family protein
MSSKPGGAAVEETQLRQSADRSIRYGARNRAGFWIRAWWPVAVGIAVISVESTVWLGADHTSGPLRRIYEMIFGAVSDPSWDVIHHYIRKTGHFIGYGFIGVAWLRAWWMSLPRSRFFPDALLALIGTALIASCDEWHQSFLPNRTGTPWDVLIDCSGAMVLCLVTYAIVRLSCPERLSNI